MKGADGGLWTLGGELRKLKHYGERRLTRRKGNAEDFIRSENAAVIDSGIKSTNL